MLNLQKQMQLSQYKGLYDAIIPQDNLLRKIKGNIDFSFINPLMKTQYCETFGRPAFEPEIMFKALFLQILYTLSDREFEQRATVDMSFKFFLELNPEDKIPDYSLLSKFRKTRISEDMLEEFLNETISQAIEKKLIKSTSIIVDSTHSKSKHAPQTPTQILREMTKELRKEIYKTQHILSDKFPEKPDLHDTIEDEIEYTNALINAIDNCIESKKGQKQLEKIKETLAQPNLMELQSANDNDAKIGHKSENGEFFGFKNHIAITENEQLITGLIVTNGNESDTHHFEELIEQSIENGVEVHEVLGDTAYSSAKNLEIAEEKNIKVISKLHPRVGALKKSTQYVHFNKDADTFECLMGNLANRHNPRKRKRGLSDVEFSFLAAHCKNCPHKKDCVTNKSDTYKRIWLTSKPDTHVKQAEFQQTEYFKERYRRRPLIEGKNADLKGNYGLGRTRGTGLLSMKLQSFLTAFTANVVKITKLATVG
jgi:IS5 family transposase